MVEKYSPRFFDNVLDFLKKQKEEGLFFTHNNMRMMVNTTPLLKQLLKETSDVWVLEENGDIVGIIVIWKSIGNGVPRFYVKISAISPAVANKLITVLIWNTKKELWVKINKESPILKTFKEKGFEFVGDRGREALFKISNKPRKNYINYKDGGEVNVPEFHKK